MSIAESTLKVVAGHSRMVRYEFEKLHVFDDHAITGLSPKTSAPKAKVRIFDWFHVRSGMEHSHERLTSDDDFVRDIIFYPSQRFGAQSGSRIRKDLVAVSYAHPEDLTSFEISDTMARFKIVEMMKAAGIRGARNGKDQNNPELYKYYSIKIESVDREIEHLPLSSYQDDERFKYIYDTPEKIISQVGLPEKTYASKILNIMENIP